MKITIDDDITARTTDIISLDVPSRDGERGQYDIALVCAPWHGTGCPLSLIVLIEPDGTAREWIADWQDQGNNYWHFMVESETNDGMTDAQRQTIARMHYGHVRPFGVHRGCGAPVLRALGCADTTELEALGNDGVRAFYAGPPNT